MDGLCVSRRACKRLRLRVRVNMVLMVMFFVDRLRVIMSASGQAWRMGRRDGGRTGIDAATTSVKQHFASTSRSTVPEVDAKGDCHLSVTRV